MENAIIHGEGGGRRGRIWRVELCVITWRFPSTHIMQSCIYCLLTCLARNSTLKRKWYLIWSFLSGRPWQMNGCSSKVWACEQGGKWTNWQRQRKDIVGLLSKGVWLLCAFEWGRRRKRTRSVQDPEFECDGYEFGWIDTWVDGSFTGNLKTNTGAW